MTQSTLPRLLRRNAEEMAGRPAIREKNHGIWQTFTWAQYWEEVRCFALGLAARGFHRRIANCLVKPLSSIFFK